MNKIDDVKKVSIIGVICNTFLIIIKLIVSIIFKSQSMLADSIHSIEDAISSILSYIGAKFTAKSNDTSHPYGHGKIEYIFSFIISITMIIAAFTMLKSSIISIFNPQNFEFSFLLITVCIFNICLKLILFIYTRRKYSKTNDILIKASMEDHRNDMFLTSSTLIGVTCGYYNIYIIDSMIGIIISFWILYIGIKLFVYSYKVLIDTNLGKLQINMVKEALLLDSDTLKVLDVVSKPVGDKYLIILRLHINDNVIFKDINNKLKEYKRILKNNFEFIYDVVIDI